VHTLPPRLLKIAKRMAQSDGVHDLLPPPWQFAIRRSVSAPITKVWLRKRLRQ
jgi:hypothetical protein